MTALAGFPGLSGSADGTNIVARFSNPIVFGVDSSGTIYLTDNNGTKIRTVSPSGDNWITATLSSPGFGLPFNILDYAGNILSSCQYSANDPNGVYLGSYRNYIVFYQAGTTNAAIFGGITNATSLTGVAVGSDGTVYVADNGASVIRQAVPSSVSWGSLHVALQTSDAVSAGAAWRVDAGLWQTNGATVTNLMAGSNHVLTFAPVYGWASPSNQWVSISNNTTTSVTGNYVQQFGSLQANLTPTAVINAGAQWQVDGGAWQSSGTVISNLTVGTHTVYFTNVVGYISPAPQTNVTIVPNQTTVLSGTYIALGAVQVNLNPPGAVSAGAQWQLDGGGWQNSGFMVTNVALGSHTISFLAAPGWITPSNQTVTVVSGQTTTVAANYIVLGSLQVTINPVGAVNGGAQWQLDGGAFQTSGTVLSNLTSGAHTLAYSPVAGYITPTNQILNINPGDTTNITTAYVALGSVSVAISPSSAVNAGAQWSLDGGSWLNSGILVSNVALGTHTISFLPTTGFITPSNSSVTVNSGQTTNVSAAYIALGNVQVSISPTNAVTGGAQWALDGGAWQASGMVLSNLTLGTHTISYFPLTSWLTPSNQAVIVASAQTTNIATAYTALGSVQVFITPIGAASAGAAWRVDSNSWQTSGSVVTNLVAGIHTVAFTNLVGWTAPTNQTVTVALSQTTVSTGMYIQQSGNLQVVLSPAGAVSEGAQWQVDSGAWQASGVTLTNVTVGSHTVAFAGISGWTAPASQPVTINSNQTTRLTAIYQGQGSLQVLIVPTGAIVSGAQWQVDGGAWMSNGMVVSGL
ncbi:MAG: hypothetical protein WCS94_21510, partial [Verrucomicrobiota bacterium]